MQFVLPRDRNGIFRYASLESETAQRLLAERGIPRGASDSLFVVPDWSRKQDQVLQKSTAILFILGHLHGPWKALVALRLIPKPWLDRSYDWVARNRYRWGGRSESCPVPDEAFRTRFLD